MAFPFVARGGFEGGTLTNSIGTTTVSGTLIDAPHFTELARQGMAPYRGAYAMRVRLAAGTTSQYIIETASFDDLTADVTRAIRWYFYLGKNFVMADTNKFSMFEAESVVDTTTEIAAGIDRSGSDIRFWVGETAAATAQTKVLGSTTSALGKWYCAELVVNLDAGGGNDGTIDAFINDSPVGVQITALDQGVIVDAKFGAIGPDAGTSGTLLIDDIIYDDATATTNRIFMDRQQYRDKNAHMTFLNDHIVIGPGKVTAAVTGTGIDAVLSLYDSDGVPDRLEKFVHIRNLTANEFVPGHDVFEFNKGCYAIMSGTGVEAFFSIDRGGVLSDGAMVAYGQAQRIPRT